MSKNNLYIYKKLYLGPKSWFMLLIVYFDNSYLKEFVVYIFVNIS